MLVANNNSDLMLILGRGAVYTNFTVGLSEHRRTPESCEQQHLGMWMTGTHLKCQRQGHVRLPNEEFLVVRGDFKGLGRYCTQSFGGYSL